MNEKNVRRSINIIPENVVTATSLRFSTECQIVLSHKTSVQEICSRLCKKVPKNIKLLFELMLELYARRGNWSPIALIARLRILVTCIGQEKLVRTLSDGCTSTQAEEISYTTRTVKTKSVMALCWDTTNPKLECRREAALIIDSKLKKYLLCLLCRHHIYESVVYKLYNNERECF